MHKQLAAEVLFWTLLSVGAALLAGLVLAFGGVVPVEKAEREAAATTLRPTDVEPRAIPAAAPSPQRRTPTTTAAAPASAPVETTVVVTATRGESWFSARLGSESGRLLDERVLALGESARFQGRRIWLSLGAAGNVDVVVDGKPRELEPGTVTFLLTGSG